MFLKDVATVFWRDWTVLKRRLTKFILSRMIAPLLYLVAFGWGLGRSGVIASDSYLDFIVPGILALNSMNISFHSVITLHAERIYHKSLEEYVLSPVSNAAFLTGKILSALLRAFISSGIIVLLAMCFGAHIRLTPLMLVVLTLNCIIFAQVGFIAAMHITTYEEMTQVNTYILLPMSFLCGTFFSTTALPQALAYFIELLPLTHTSRLLRSLAEGQPPSVAGLLILAGYATILFFVSRKTFNNE